MVTMPRNMSHFNQYERLEGTGQRATVTTAQHAQHASEPPANTQNTFCILG